MESWKNDKTKIVIEICQNTCNIIIIAGFQSLESGLVHKAHDINAGFHNAEISLDNKLRESAQAADKKLNDTNQSAHADLDDFNEAASNFFGKSLLPKE